MKKAWQAPDIQIIRATPSDVVTASVGWGIFETGVSVKEWFNKTGGNDQ